MTRKTATELRKDVSGILERVAKRHDRIVLRSRGKDMAVLVPLDDLALIEALEDRIDLEEARKALEEPGESIPLAEVKKRLGL